MSAEFGKYDHFGIESFRSQRLGIHVFALLPHYQSIRSAEGYRYMQRIPVVENFTNANAQVHGPGADKREKNCERQKKYEHRANA